MPGMMDTILNVGITEESLPYWIEKMGYQAAMDCYCRMLCMMGETAYGIKKECLSEKYHALKGSTNIEAIRCDLMIALNFHKTTEFWTDIHEQYRAAIVAVWGSWKSERAIEYRDIHGYAHDWGTAVVIQQMVFGNMDDQSCSGVLFTRNPDTGEPDLVGDYLVNAQGEDVVSGISNPEPISGLSSWNLEVSDDLVCIALSLEKQYKDMVDIEFTVESGKLYILQARIGKRSSVAAVKIAYDLWLSVTIEFEELRKRVKYSDYLNVTKSGVDYDNAPAPDYFGIPASYGVITGLLTTDINLTIDNPGKYILVRPETTPDDLKGMIASVGLITKYGGATSHAAVVARGLGVPCIVGCVCIDIGGHDITFEDNGGQSVLINQGTPVTMDGSLGNIWFNKEVPMITGNNNMLTDFTEALLCNEESFEYSKKIDGVIPSTINVQYDLEELDRVLTHVSQPTTIIIGSSCSNLGGDYNTIMSIMGDCVISDIQLAHVLDKHIKKIKYVCFYPLNVPVSTIDTINHYGFSMIKPCKTIAGIMNNVAGNKIILAIDYLNVDDQKALDAMIKLAGISVFNASTLRSRATVIKQLLC
jgi:pyruvate,orthophosphate dikinase